MSSPHPLGSSNRNNIMNGVSESLKENKENGDPTLSKPHTDNMSKIMSHSGARISTPITPHRKKVGVAACLHSTSESASLTLRTPSRRHIPCNDLVGSILQQQDAAEQSVNHVEQQQAKKFARFPVSSGDLTHAKLRSAYDELFAEHQAMMTKHKRLENSILLKEKSHDVALTEAKTLAHTEIRAAATAKEDLKSAQEVVASLQGDINELQRNAVSDNQKLRHGELTIQELEVQKADLHRSLSEAKTLINDLREEKDKQIVELERLLRAERISRQYADMQWDTHQSKQIDSDLAAQEVRAELDEQQRVIDQASRDLECRSEQLHVTEQARARRSVFFHNEERRRLELEDNLRHLESDYATVTLRMDSEIQTLRSDKARLISCIEGLENSLADAKAATVVANASLSEERLNVKELEANMQDLEGALTGTETDLQKEHDLYERAQRTLLKEHKLRLQAMEALQEERRNTRKYSDSQIQDIKDDDE